MSEIIKTENLQYAYPAEEGQLSVPVLKGVDLSIKRGEFVAVLGHNGSGKSTLAGCFNAIRLPTGGVCYVDMMDTRDESNTYEVRKTVSMVFQNPDNQLVATVVEEDVAFALENMGVPPAEIRKRVGRSAPRGRHVRIPQAGAAPPVRRTEAACGHRGRDRHDAALRGA